MSPALGAAAVFAADLFNGVLGHSVAVSDIGTTQSQILGNDPERVSLLLINLSVNTIYVGFDEAVGSSKGIILEANGGYVSFNAKDDFILTTLQMNAIAIAALSSLYVLTQTRIAKADREVE